MDLDRDAALAALERPPPARAAAALRRRPRRRADRATCSPHTLRPHDHPTSASSASATGGRISPATSTACPALRADAGLRRVGGGARALGAAASRAPRLTADLDELLADPELDAVVVATPVPTHARARRARARGRQALLRREAARAVGGGRRARGRRGRGDAGRVLMVGHLLEYHPGVEKLKELADSRRARRHPLHLLEPPQPRASCAPTRTRSGSLGAHDVSVLLHLAGARSPTSATRSARATCSPGVEDVVFCYLRFPSGLAAHLHLSWLDPHKERRFTVVGSKRMATFDDMDDRAQGHGLRQGLRPGLRLLRRVHHALGRHLEPARAQRGAAADRVRALPRVRARRRRAALGRRTAGCAWCACWRRCSALDASEGARVLQPV